MNSLLLGLLAETSIHPGAGRSVGVVDLPVAREAATDYPVLVGSSLKGALRQWAVDAGLNSADVDKLFGQRDHAGELSIADARLVLLPVRSLDSAYKWVTCPHLLERLDRDLKRAGLTGTTFAVPGVAAGEAHAIGGNGMLYLEERQFTVQKPVSPEILRVLRELIAHADTCHRLESQVVIVSNDDFAWFARYGLPVNARNKLDDKKTSGYLWYEETLPADTLFCALLAERPGSGALDKLKLKDKPYLQAGGNETVGMGWFSVATYPQP